MTGGSSVQPCANAIRLMSWLAVLPAHIRVRPDELALHGHRERALPAQRFTQIVHSLSISVKGTSADHLQLVEAVYLLPLDKAWQSGAKATIAGSCKNGRCLPCCPSLIHAMQPRRCVRSARRARVAVSSRTCATKQRLHAAGRQRLLMCASGGLDCTRLLHALCSIDRAPNKSVTLLHACTCASGMRLPLSRTSPHGRVTARCRMARTSTSGTGPRRTACRGAGSAWSSSCQALSSARHRP